MAPHDVTKLLIRITDGQLPLEIEDGTPIGRESFGCYSRAASAMLISLGMISAAINSQLLRQPGPRT
jgi:hypothetical protein